MILKTLKIANFFCVLEAEIDFENQGLVFLLGENLDKSDSDFAESNLSGKSTIFEAVCRWLYDKTFRRVRAGKDCILRGETTCILEGIVNNKILRREYSTKGKNLLYLDNKEISQVELEEFLGMNWSEFTSYAMFGDKEAGSKIDSFGESTNSEKFEFLQPFFNGELWDAAKIKVQEKLNLLFSKITLKESDVSTLDTEISNIETRIDEKQNNIVSIQEKITDLKSWQPPDLTLLKGQAKQHSEFIITTVQKTLDSEKQKTEAIEIKNNMQEEKKNIELLEQETGGEYTEQQRKLLLASSVIKGLIESKNKAQELIDNEQCPICESDISESDKLKDRVLEAHKRCAEKQNEETVLKNQMQQTILPEWNLAKNDLQRIKFDIDEQTKKIDHIATNISNLKELKSDLEKKLQNTQHEFETKKNEQDLVVKEIEGYKIDLIQINTQILESNNNKITVEKKRRTVLKQIYAFKIDQQYYEYWITMYGNTGCKSEEVKCVIPVINKQIESFAPRVLNSDYNIELSGAKELKKGGMKNEIGISLDGEYFGLSTSEKLRVNTTLNLSIGYIYPKRCNVLFFDELLSSLDPKGTQIFVNLFQDLIDDGLWESIFVISHNGSDMFDKKWVVRKENKVSKLITN